MKPSELLYRAAEILQERGHAKSGEYMAPTGEVCQMGACRLAAGVTEDHIGTRLLSMILPYDTLRPLQKAGKALHIRANHLGYGSVGAFNDAPDTSTEDVLLGLKHCAAELEAEGE